MLLFAALGYKVLVNLCPVMCSQPVHTFNVNDQFLSPIIHYSLRTPLKAGHLAKIMTLSKPKWRLVNCISKGQVLIDILLKLLAALLQPKTKHSEKQVAEQKKNLNLDAVLFLLN